MLILIGAVPERLVHGDQSRPLLPSSLALPGPAVGFSTATLIQGSSHEPGTVNYPGVMVAPGQALPRVHMMICCPGTTLPRVNFIALGQVQRYLITTNLSEFL